MSTRLKAMIALASLGYSHEEFTILADLIVWTTEQPGERRGWLTIAGEIVERYEAARAEMA